MQGFNWFWPIARTHKPEEVSGTNDLSAESKQHDTKDTEQKFGMYMREFDFLEYELESLEVCLYSS